MASIESTPDGSEWKIVEDRRKKRAKRVESIEKKSSVMASIESTRDGSGSKAVENRKKKPAKSVESNLTAKETKNKAKVAEADSKMESKPKEAESKEEAEAASKMESKEKEAEAVSKMESKPRNLTLAEAASKIDPSHLAAYLSESQTWFPRKQLLKLVDYFDEALSGVNVSSVQFPWPDLDKLLPLMDYPVNQLPRPVYKTAGDWITTLSFELAAGYIMWALGFIRARMAGTRTPPKSDVSVFVVLAMVLRKRRRAYCMILHFLRREPFKSEALLPVTVWMMAQVTQIDVCMGFFSWANNLLPLAGDKHYYRKPESMDLVLQLVEAIVSYPNAPAILVSDKVHEGKGRLMKPLQFEVLLRLTFPPPYARTKDTERFEAIYPLLKELALAHTPGKEATNRLILEIFIFCLRFAGEGNQVLAKEATSIAMWCLTKNVDCCRHWNNVYNENPKGSVALLKQLDRNHSHEISWRDVPTVKQTMKSFMLKNKIQITQGGADASLFQAADKYCNEISRRIGLVLKGIAIGSLYKEAGMYCKEISRGIGFLKGKIIPLSRGSGFPKGIAIALYGSDLFKSIAITAFVVLLCTLVQTYSIRIQIERRFHL